MAIDDALVEDASWQIVLKRKIVETKKRGNNNNDTDLYRLMHTYILFDTFILLYLRVML